ncbi:MAG: ion transporter [Methanosarcinaceae archaeon]|nr:ion transporter [Methanosarcinaceae archaeon]
MLKIWYYRCLETFDYIAKIIIGRGCGIFSEELLQFSGRKASWNGKIMREKVKKRVFEILEVASDGDVFSRMVDIFIMALILTNVMAVILETVGSLADRYMLFFNTFELFSVAIFTLEYVLRLWTCTADKRFTHPLKGRFKFAVTPLALVDLLAILPFFLPMIIPLDLRFMRALRLFRFFRLLKMSRYSDSLRTFAVVFKTKKEELVMSMFFILVLLVISSSLMYFCENGAQPEAFSSIPVAMWWGVSTLTTVGYGDIYPITPLGRVLGAVISILGIGMFALPTGILGSGFIEQIQKRPAEKSICPHCGNDVNVPPEKLIGKE